MPQCGEPVPQADIFRALHQIAVALAGVLDPRTLAYVVTEHARGLVQADACGLFAWSADSGLLEPLYVMDAPPDIQIRPGEGVVGQAFEQRRPVVLDDYQAASEAIPWAVARGTRTAAAVPLLVDDRPIGVLAVRNHRDCPFSMAQAQILELLAAFVAPALEAARLYVESDRQRQAATEHGQQLGLILEHLPSAVVVLDANGNVALSNEAARRIGPLELGLDRRLADRALAGETIAHAELRVRPLEQQADLWLQVSGAPLRLPSGRINGAVLVYTDVTRERTLSRDLAATALEHAHLLGQLADRKARLEHLAAQVAEPWLEPLSDREREILRLIARGRTNREIGAVLHLSAGTVRNRVGRLLGKLGATDRTHAAVMAVAHGLLDAE